MKMIHNVPKNNSVTKAQTNMKFIMKLSMLALVLIVGVIFWSLFSGVWLENSSVFKENGLLENTQAFTLTITLLFFLAPMFNRFRSDRLLAVFFSFLMGCAMGQMCFNQQKDRRQMLYAAAAINDTYLITIKKQAIENMMDN